MRENTIFYVLLALTPLILQLFCFVSQAADPPRKPHNVVCGAVRGMGRENA